MRACTGLGVCGAMLGFHMLMGVRVAALLRASWLRLQRGGNPLFLLGQSGGSAAGCHRVAGRRLQIDGVTSSQPGDSDGSVGQRGFDPETSRGSWGPSCHVDIGLGDGARHTHGAGLCPHSAGLSLVRKVCPRVLRGLGGCLCHDHPVSSCSGRHSKQRAWTSESQKKA